MKKIALPASVVLLVFLTAAACPQGANNIIWSYGATDAIDQRHAVRGEDSIVL